MKRTLGKHGWKQKMIQKVMAFANAYIRLSAGTTDGVSLDCATSSVGGGDYYTRRCFTMKHPAEEGHSSSLFLSCQRHAEKLRLDVTLTDDWLKFQSPIIPGAHRAFRMNFSRVSTLWQRDKAILIPPRGARVRREQPEVQLI